jgi:hypothetical protein
VERTLDRTERVQERTKPVTFVAFFISVMAALVHVVMGFYEHLAESGSATEHVGFSLFLLLASVAVPVVAGAIRIYRSAFEPGRNTARYAAHGAALASLVVRVEKAPEAALAGELWLSEQILDWEHRAWLQLMMEAEWFG